MDNKKVIASKIDKVLRLWDLVLRPTAMVFGAAGSFLLLSSAMTVAHAAQQIQLTTITLDSEPVGTSVKINGQFYDVVNTPANREALANLKAGSQADIWFQDRAVSPATGAASLATPKINAIVVH